MALRPGIAAAVAGGVLTVFAAALSIGAGPAARNPTFAVAPPGPGGAANLRLAPGLSFVDDSSSEFPIRGDGLEDGRIASDRPTVVFFGTSHCYNTNREAERLVAFYAKHRAEARFLVVDLRAPSSDQDALVAALYGIPRPRGARRLRSLGRNGGNARRHRATRGAPAPRGRRAAGRRLA